MTLTDKIDSLLPQTQCTRCGFEDCLAYAQAIAQENTPHNQCPPGKEAGIKSLSKALNRPILPLNLEHGTIQPKFRAFIREAECIGCTKCLQVCPVDAIVGAAKKLHTVIEKDCTGCDLCIPQCPVDCIDWIELPSHQQPENLSPPAQETLKNHYRDLHLRRKNRLNRQAAEKLARHAALKNLKISLKPGSL